jgi:hypothetical protein
MTSGAAGIGQPSSSEFRRVYFVPTANFQERAKMRTENKPEKQTMQWMTDPFSATIRFCQNAQFQRDLPP